MVRAGRTSDFGYRHLVELDIPALIAAAGNSEHIAGVVLIASGSVHLPCYHGKLRWGVRVLTTLSGIVGPVLGYFPGARLEPRCPDG